jgi:hypothetical protein
MSRRPSSLANRLTKLSSVQVLGTLTKMLACRSKAARSSQLNGTIANRASATRIR